MFVSWTILNMVVVRWRSFCVSAPRSCPTTDDESLLRLAGHSRLVDALHTYIIAGLYWKYLAMCHGASTLDCPPKLPW